MRCMVEMGAQFIRRQLNKLRLSVWGIAGEGSSTVHGTRKGWVWLGWLAIREEGVSKFELSSILFSHM